MRPVSFSAKMITAGVVGKAILIGVLVEVLALTSFTRSIILVLVSACATGVFGVIVVLVQTHSEAHLHRRIDTLESKANTVVAVTHAIETKADAIESAVTPNEEEEL